MGYLYSTACYPQEKNHYNGCYNYKDYVSIKYGQLSVDNIQCDHQHIPGIHNNIFLVSGTVQNQIPCGNRGTLRQLGHLSQKVLLTPCLFILRSSDLLVCNYQHLIYYLSYVWVWCFQFSRQWEVTPHRVI